MKLLPIVLIVFVTRAFTWEVIKQYDLTDHMPCEQLTLKELTTTESELSVEDMVSPGIKW